MKASVAVSLRLTALNAPAAAVADDWISSKLKGQAERTFISTQPFYDVERCVVYSAVRGWLYRSPDRPGETLWIDAGHGSSQHILWQLRDMHDGSVRLDVFEGTGNLNDDTKGCFGKLDVRYLVGGGNSCVY